MGIFITFSRESDTKNIFKTICFLINSKPSHSALTKEHGLRDFYKIIQLKNYEIKNQNTRHIY